MKRQAGFLRWGTLVLILVFIVCIFFFQFLESRNLFALFGDFHNSTKSSFSTYRAGRVSVIHISEAIKHEGGTIVDTIKSNGKRIVRTHFPTFWENKGLTVSHGHIYRSNFGCFREARDLREIVAIPEKKYGDIGFTNVGTIYAGIYDSHPDSYSILFPNIAIQKYMFKANVGAMRGNKVISHSIDGLAHSPSLYAKNYQLQYTDSEQESSKYSKLIRKSRDVPIEVKFFFSLCGIAGGFFLSVLGWDYFDNKRQFAGSSIVVFGTILGALGFGVFLL